ncbi:hypothetical protein AJ79_02950 [Helicocarpus griseus UAMH5409]|uniref:CREG-like beta-barrel domain-containing protein n=1 Tax=Helicocarpus griseus UAMH5409 TaxID=1447875 RepID=A0A2B7Y091_9EURO|nr:hypothetical protein AJ79_02950 [Helicocarpus griseus UAMH5409]
MRSPNIVALSSFLLLSLAAAYPSSMRADANKPDNSIIDLVAQVPISPKEKTGFFQPIETATNLNDDDDPVPKPDYTFPSWDTAHLRARRLLALSTTGVLSTVYPHSSSVHRSSLKGVPVGLPDYIADCANGPDSELANLLGPGNPLILALNVGTTFRNTKAGSNISLSIDWWHQGASKAGNNVSLASLPRLSLLGYLEPLNDLPDTSRKAVEKCFLDSHSDAAWWLPGHENAAHSGYWARMVVEEAFWIGGFGDRARIGWLVPDTWRSVTKHGENGKQGWADVKLPGE